MILNLVIACNPPTWICNHHSWMMAMKSVLKFVPCGNRGTLIMVSLFQLVTWLTSKAHCMATAA